MTQISHKGPRKVLVGAVAGLFFLLAGQLHGSTATTTTVSSSLNPSTYGASVTLAATVTPSSGGPPSGTVLFTIDGVQQTPLTVTSSGTNGVADLGLASLFAGTHTVSAQYSGDATYSSSSNSLAGLQTVNKAALSITANNASKLFGGTATYGMGVTAFTSVGLQNGETINSVTVIASGGTSPNSPVGVYTLTPSAAKGGTFNSSNYTITYIPGTLTVKPLPAPICIMPVGDSITYGSESGQSPIPGGYRSPLYTLLFNAGYYADFVGTQSGNPGLTPNIYHEGHPGWEIAQIDSIISGALNSILDPDVILLLIGTNDYGDNDETGNATNRLDALITQMATERPYAKIIVANLTIRNEPYNTEIETTFNPYVPGIVAAQQALGRAVYFDDMRSAVPLADLDSTPLHPNQTGYDAMATNWFQIITNLFTPVGSYDAPAIARVVGQTNLTNVVVTFSKPINTNTAVAANFSLSGGLTVKSASLDLTGQRKVTLTTTLQQPQTTYTLTVNGVTDQNQIALATNTTASFQSSPHIGATNNVAEAANYQLVYSLNISNNNSFATNVNYNIDRHTSFTNFTRVAYYLELQTIYGGLDYLWVSMDAFTINISQIGVPAAGTGAVFKQAVSNLNVFSSDPDIISGTQLSGGFMQFSPGTYSQASTLGVTNASDNTDWGNTRTYANYGSMEIVNFGAGQILFAFDDWAGGATNAADLGIGNNPGSVDWTYAANAGSYAVKTMQVYVLPVSAPTLAVSLNGANLVIRGSNGPAFANYFLLSATNAAIPSALWTPVASNSLDGTGSFAWTNAIDTASARFFRLKIQ